MSLPAPLLGLTIPTEFDGHAFVPLTPVVLPEGTRCVVQLPLLQPPPPITDEHRQLWDEVTRQVEAGPPPYPNVDEAMRAMRGRP